ncbi:MAG: two-component regulator propeller domain-containing protein, partial [Pyrinomonadaceae bacterium]
MDPQRDLSEFSRDLWLTENGLPQNTVHAITQTKDGYVWIATEEGLARYDGISFTVFDKQNTAQFKSNDVRALMEDRQGALWISTANGLIRLLDGKFSSLTTREGLASNTIESVYEDRAGSLWVATSAGLNRFKDGAMTTFTTREGLASNNV